MNEQAQLGLMHTQKKKKPQRKFDIMRIDQKRSFINLIKISKCIL